ncbi:MAG: RDD family protein [Chitinophagales bacterium]
MEILDDHKEGPLTYARFTDRVFAYLIDLVLLGLAGWAMQLLLGVNVFSSSYRMIWFGNVATLLYFIVMEGGRNNATFGKMIMRIRVVDENGLPISYEKAAIRNICKIVSALPLLIGFIMTAFTDKHRALHDMLAHTLVVKEDTK